MKSRTKSQNFAKLSYLFLIGYILLTTVIKSMNMPMLSQRAVILLWPQENWKWWSDRNKDTSKDEELKRLTCYSIFNLIICWNYTRCSGPWHRGWSKAVGADSCTVGMGVEPVALYWGSTWPDLPTCFMFLAEWKQDQAVTQILLFVASGRYTCWENAKTSFWIQVWGNSWLLLHIESINQVLILGTY